MFDSIFNLIIILIPISIFIGRAVVRARSRHSPPSTPTQSPIPLHFEVDKEEFERAEAATLEYMPWPDLSVPVQPKKPAPVPAPSKKRPARVELAPLDSGLPGLTPLQAPGRQAVSLPPPLKLAHLSPMQQAVVMAEVLGPPKAIG
jgi:hypothetical protein